MIGAVSAANNDTVVSSDVDDDTVTSIEDNSGETGTVLTQTDTKTVSNDDEPILNESKEIDVKNYTELVNAIKDAENTSYSQYKLIYCLEIIMQQKVWFGRTPLPVILL